VTAPQSMPLLEIHGLRKSYRLPDGSTHDVLDIPHFTLDAGEEVALEGSSGSGKTTLLHTIAGILRPDAGSVRLCGTDVFALSEAQRDTFRARTIGYVFQSFHLLAAYTALENVLLGMAFGRGPDRAFARSLLADLDLGDRLDHRPAQLSIGQRQRVAVARALAARPRLVLADEPTGNLDRQRARDALALMRELCARQDAALLVVSHDQEVLAGFERRIALAELSRQPAPRGRAGAREGA